MPCMSPQSESEHILELSRELLDDIELGRLEADKLLLKCSRLARLAGSEEVKFWIKHEMEGYNVTDKFSLLYMGKTGRWTNYKEKKGYWHSLAMIESAIGTQKARLMGSKLGNVSADAHVGTINVVNTAQESISSTITTMSGIRSRVLGMLHTFVVGVFYERQFAKLAENIFEQYKKDVDALIAEKAGEVLNKIPSVIARLQEGDEEGISQALTTCRRIIETFADAVYPPTTGTVELGDNTLLLDASKHKNRLNAYIAARTASSARRDKLRQNLSNLFDRVSAGVHTDVTSEEAFSLFLNVYLFLGEVLHLGAPDTSNTAAI
jgi:AbiTii